jgi:predicted deacylase
MDDLMNWTTTEVPIKQLATGHNLTVKTHTISGKPGPHIHIQASVHGAELQGNAVILKLMEKLKDIDLHGSITFVPLANPWATNNKHGTYTYGRYNPVTGDNWNRNYTDIFKIYNKELKAFCTEYKDDTWEDIKKKFKSFLKSTIDKHVTELERTIKISNNNKLNLFLQQLASRADGILDLHTGPTATRYLYASDYAEDRAKYLLFKYVLVMPSVFAGAMDEAGFMPWIHLQNSLKELGRNVDLDIESYTLEFGSEETFCMKSATGDVESIINYLKYKGLIKEEPKIITAHYAKLKHYQTIYSPNGGLVDYNVLPGDIYKKGDVLASIYNLSTLDPEKPIESTKDEILAIADGIIINRCPSSSVHEGMELLQIMSHTYSK